MDNAIMHLFYEILNYIKQNPEEGKGKVQVKIDEKTSLKLKFSYKTSEKKNQKIY